MKFEWILNGNLSNLCKILLSWCEAPNWIVWQFTDIKKKLYSILT